MDIDYTSYSPGVALAREVILAVCPKCGEVGHVKAQSKQTVVVHEASIVWRQPRGVEASRRRDGTYNPRRVRASVRPQRQCRLTESDWIGLTPEQRAAADWRTYVCGESADGGAP